MILEFNDTPEGLVVDVEVVAGEGWGVGAAVCWCVWQLCGTPKSHNQ